MMIVVSTISLLVHIYSTDYVGGDRRYTHYFAFLSLFSASMLLLVMSRNTGAVHHRVGAGRRLLVRAHRPLVGGEAELRRRPQGVPHQPGRRHRPARRHDRPVLGRPAPSTSSDINEFANGVTGGNDHLLLLVASLLPHRRGDVEVGPVHPPHLAARRHGRPDAGLGAHPRRHDGGGRHLHGRPALRRVLRGPLRSAPPTSTSSPWSAPSPSCSGRCWRSCRTTSRRCSPTRRSASSATWRWPSGSGVDGGGVPPLHPRLLQGRALPRVGLGGPRGAQLRHEEGHGRHAAVHAPDLRHLPDLHRGAHRHLPARRASGRRTRSSPAPTSSAARAATSSMFVMGLVGAFCTAAYMTRCVYLTFFGEPAGSRRRPAPPAARVGPRILVPLYILSALALVAGFANLPVGGSPRGHQAAVRALRRAGGAVLPRDRPLPEFTWWVAARVRRPRPPRHRPRLRLLLAGPVPRRHRAQHASPGPATPCWSRSTTSTTSTPASSPAA